MEQTLSKRKMGNSKGNLWARGSFIQGIKPEEIERKEKTIHMKNDEDMNYDCKECKKKISAHNRDWHDGMCDACFDSAHSPEGEEEFIPLADLLEKDTKKALAIKSLLDREMEYADYLGAIEYAVADHFSEKGDITDSEVAEALKKIRDNYLQGMDFFKTELEKDIVMGLSLALQDMPITHHELKLVLNYILWSIDNRSWMCDPQGYVKWISYTLETMDEKMSAKFVKDLKSMMKKAGIPSGQINAVLGFGKAELTDDETMATTLESEFFALPENKRYTFVIEHFEQAPYLIATYGSMLEEEKNYGEMERFYTAMLEKMPRFPPMEVSLGRAYGLLGKKELALTQLDKALAHIKEVPKEALPDSAKEDLMEIIDQERKSIERGSK